MPRREHQSQKLRVRALHSLQSKEVIKKKELTMAPRHPEVDDMNRMHGDDEPSFSDFDEDAYGHHSMSESAFDPFDTTEFDDEFDDSFSQDFADTAFPDSDVTKPTHSSVQKPERRRRRDSRLDESASRRMNGSSTRTSTRVKTSSNAARLSGNHAKLDESTSRFDDSSRRVGMDESSRRRTPKPTVAPSFPKNARRGSGASSRVRARPARPSASPPSPTSSTPPSTRDRRASIERSKGSRRSLDSKGSRRSLLDDSSHQQVEETPVSPGGNRRASASRVGGRSPRPRDSVAPKRDSLSSRRESTSKRESITAKRDAIGASDARSRIRKEAALKKERDLREEQEAKLAKLARQKEKLAQQKQKTNELLGRKLARLDARNGETSETPQGEEASMGSRALNSSIHSNTREQRRRRRTHLSHNILVRNMNQMAARAEEDHVEVESEDGDTFHDDDVSMSNSMIDSSKKEAWQRRRERQKAAM